MIRYKLSEWYAQFQSDWRSAETRKRAPSPEYMQHGPLKIFHKDTELEVSTFGPDKRSVCIFEGYLFDHNELANRLNISRPVPTESLLIASAYQKWGRDLFNNIDGGYLAAIWDAQKQEFILGHDGLGKHPIYYAEIGNKWLFSSNIFALTNSGKISSSPNRLSLGLRILGRWPQAGQTFFEAVHRVKPGHFLLKQKEAARREIEFWRPTSQNSYQTETNTNILEEFSELLSRSVAHHMKLGPRGIFLSGGIDSVIIAALAKDYSDQHNQDPLIAYSGVNPPGYSTTYEEESQIASTQRLGMELRTSHAGDWLSGKELISATLEQVAFQSH